MVKATAMVLSEYIQHHVREEESEMFPKARRLKLDLEELAAPGGNYAAWCRASIAMAPRCCCDPAA